MMSKQTWLSLGLAALMLLVPASGMWAQDAEEEAQPQAQADAREAVVAQALAFRDAYAERDAETLWGLQSEDSRARLEQDLNELKAPLREMPEDRRARQLPGLSVSADDILALRSGREYLEWLLSEVDDRDLELVKELTITAEDVTVEEDRAELEWRLAEDGDEAAAYLTDQMPQSAVRENDEWRIVVTSE